MIGTARQPETDSRLERIGGSPVVANGEQLMGLLAAWIEVPQRPEIVVFLGRQRPPFRQVQCKARGRREIESREALVRVVQNWIDNEVKSAHVPTHNGSNLRGVAVLVPVARVIA